MVVQDCCYCLFQGCNLILSASGLLDEWLNELINIQHVMSLLPLPSGQHFHFCLYCFCFLTQRSKLEGSGAFSHLNMGDKPVKWKYCYGHFGKYSLSLPRTWRRGYKALNNGMEEVRWKAIFLPFWGRSFPMRGEDVKGEPCVWLYEKVGENPRFSWVKTLQWRWGKETQDRRVPGQRGAGSFCPDVAQEMLVHREDAAP